MKIMPYPEPKPGKLTGTELRVTAGQVRAALRVVTAYVENQADTDDLVNATLTLAERTVKLLDLIAPAKD